MDKLKKYFLIITFAAPFLSALLFTNNVLAWEFPKELKNTADKEFHVEENKEQVLLYFWATWCPECKHSFLTILPKLQIRKDLQVLAVNTDKAAKDVEEYKESNKISTESITDPDRKIRKAFKVFSVPTAVLLKKENEQWIAKKSYIGAEQIAQIESDLNKMSK